MSKYIDYMISWCKLNKAWAAAIICGALIIAFWGRLGSITSDTGLILFGLITLMVAVGDFWWWKQREKTHHLVMQDFHASIKNSYPTTDGYRVIPVGSIDANEWSWNGGLGTVIAPENIFTYIGNEMIGYARPVPTDLSMLPESVRLGIEGRIWGGVGPPFYYAETPLMPFTVYQAGAMFIEELKRKNPEMMNNGGSAEALKNLEALQAQWKEFLNKKVFPQIKREYEHRDQLNEAKIKFQNQQIDFLEKLADGKGEVIVKAADSAAAILKGFGPERMKKYVLKEPYEERRREE